MGKKTYEFVSWEDATREPIRHIKVKSDTLLMARYEDKGIMAHVTGIRGQLEVMIELYNLNLDVYSPVIDIRGIDYIVTDHCKGKVKYSEIQVKTRATNKRGRYIFEVKDFEPRKNFFIVCHWLDTDIFWILPSKIFYKHATLTARGKRRLQLNTAKQKKLEEYKNNWGQLILA